MKCASGASKHDDAATFISRNKHGPARKPCAVTLTRCSQRINDACVSQKRAMPFNHKATACDQLQ